MTLKIKLAIQVVVKISSKILSEMCVQLHYLSLGTFPVFVVRLHLALIRLSPAPLRRRRVADVWDRLGVDTNPVARRSVAAFGPH